MTEVGPQFDVADAGHMVGEGNKVSLELSGLISSVPRAVLPLRDRIRNLLVAF